MGLIVEHRNQGIMNHDRHWKYWRMDWKMDPLVDYKYHHLLQCLVSNHQSFRILHPNLDLMDFVIKKCDCKFENGKWTKSAIIASRYQINDYNINDLKYTPLNGDSEPSFESSFSSLLSTLSRREAVFGKIRCGPKRSNVPWNPRPVSLRSSLLEQTIFTRTH